MKMIKLTTTWVDRKLQERAEYVASVEPSWGLDAVINVLTAFLLALMTAEFVEAMLAAARLVASDHSLPLTITFLEEWAARATIASWFLLFAAVLIFRSIRERARLIRAGNGAVRNADGLPSEAGQ